jgi:hypothetical protein
MSTNNEINNLNNLFTTTNGGLGASSYTANSIIYARGTTFSFQSTALSAGQVYIGNPSGSMTSTPLAGQAGCVVTNTSGSVLIAMTAAKDITWHNTTTTTVALPSSGLNGYICNSASLITLTLNSPGGGLAVGTIYSICGLGAGGWLIAQNSSQQILYNNTATTAGVGGSLASSNQYDQVDLVYNGTNTFTVISSIGTLTVV